MINEPRMRADYGEDALHGEVKWAAKKSLWVSGMLIAGIGGALSSLSLENFLVFLMSTATTICFGHSLGMHRLFIHRSYQTYKWVEYLFVWLGVLVGLAGPLGMMKTHDLRDWAQRQKACHDYFAHKKIWYVDLWWQLHCDVLLENGPQFTPEPEILNDRFYQFIEKTWMLQQLPVALVFYLSGGWQWVVWGVCLRVIVSIFGHWLIGYFAHNNGERKWHVSGASVQGYNIKFCGLITMGECWHNNHHAFPGSALLGIENNQTDPGWWVLVMMRQMGWVWNIKKPDDLAYRKELIRLSATDNTVMIKTAARS